jgi:hypothetical protein
MLAVMTLFRLAGGFAGRARAKSRTQAPIEKPGDLGSDETGASDPIDAVGDGPHRASWASSMGFGRGSAICEYDEIMQILPGSSDDARLIEALSGIRNIRDVTRRTLKVETEKFRAP